MLPDGRVITGGGDRRVRLWDPQQPGQPISVTALDDFVYHLDTRRIAESDVLALGTSQGVTLWNLPHRRPPADV